MGPPRTVQFEYRIVDRLMRELSLTVRFYFILASALFCAAICLLAVSAVEAPTESIEKIISTVVGIFGLIPLPLAFSTRAQRAALLCLKERWEYAIANNDVQEIKRIRARFEKLEDDVIQKGIGIVK